jgi:mono/diheme cytochrome c family protein
MRLPGAAALLLALTACPRLDPMQRQPRYESYQESDHHADGAAMRMPPAHTVPYRSVGDAVVQSGLGGDGRPVARSPLPVNAAQLARGRARFDVFCAACHGVLGDGESQVALNMSLRKPANFHALRDVADGHIFRVVTEGFGLMPSYASALSVEDRWAIVSYVRALQLSQHAALEHVPAADRTRLQEERR